MRDDGGLSDERARQALLSESFRHFPHVASGTPARSARHPFSKVIGISPDKVVAQWKGETKVPQVTQSCPDLALRDPAPCRVVFEAKYFRNGSEKVQVGGCGALGREGAAYERALHDVWDVMYRLQRKSGDGSR